MISVAKYVEGVESIYTEQPSYQLGHDGSDGTCDCIGMVRGGLKRGGEKSVSGLSGTNYAARKTIKELQKLESANALVAGDVVLKVRDKDDKNMPLPDRYRKGGADYSEKWGETNFTHIGTVTSKNPLVITHMTSPTAKKDKSIKGWSYFGELPYVKYEEVPEPPPEYEPGTAMVTAPSGRTVKMRARPSTSCRTYWDVPVGSEVIVDEWGTEWSRITWKDRMGYMMTKFLTSGDSGGYYTVTIPHLTRETADNLILMYGGTMREE